jgi:hypothetical protein
MHCKHKKNFGCFLKLQHHRKFVVHQLTRNGACHDACAAKRPAGTKLTWTTQVIATVKQEGCAAEQDACPARAVAAKQDARSARAAAAAAEQDPCSAK